MLNHKRYLVVTAISGFFFLNTFLISASLKCQFCKKNINGRYITQNKSAYHEQCYKDHIQLRCDHCKKVINGKYNINDKENYHQHCYRDFILEKCDVCLNPIESEYVKDTWGNIYHNYHRSSMPLCESCNRLISINLTDGGYSIKNRSICNICRNHVINDKEDIQKIFYGLRKELLELGMSNIPKNIPVILIDSKEELYRISNIPASDGLQGYTKYNYQTIGRKKINENFTIYILSNLHRLNFRAVLAHEILHVYLFNNNISLKKSLIEGFCNLGSKFVYNSAPESKISELKLESMFINNHPEYGRGFRIMDAELERKGWAVLLKNLENY